MGDCFLEKEYLALLVPEEQQEVRTVASVYDVQDPLPGLPVDGAGENDVLDSVQDDGAVRFRSWLAVQSGA